jgi:glycosyltransferase involved in cell wall biosynthesis
MKLLIVSPVPPEPQTAGNRARVSNLITILEHLGCDVTFAYVPYESADYKAMEARLGHRLRCLQSKTPPFQTVTGRAKRKVQRILRLRSARLWRVDEWFDDSLLSQVTSLQKKEHFDTALIEYVFLSKLACVFPGSVRTIIDTHDLMGDRDKIYLNCGLQPAWFATTPKEEIRALNRADAVIAIQQEEARYLRRYVSAEVFCVGHVGALDIRPVADPGGSRILFVGSANPINIHGLEWFVRSVLPKIRARIPDCELAIAGPAGSGRTWPNGVFALGPVESLALAYAEAALVINPVTFGTGLPVKTIEALSYGKPLVATTAGVRGLALQFAEAFYVAEDADGFARAVVELLQNRAARARLSQNALAAMHSWRLQQLATLDYAIKGVRSFVPERGMRTKKLPVGWSTDRP